MTHVSGVSSIYKKINSAVSILIWLSRAKSNQEL